MGKLIHFKKKKTKGYAASTGYRTARSPGLGGSGRSARLRSARRRGLKGFVRRNFKLLLIAGAGVVVVVVGVVLLTGGANTPVSAQPADAVGAADDGGGEHDVYDYSGYSADELAGLEGTDEGLFVAEEHMADALAQEGIRIGVSVGNLGSGEDEAVINRLEEVWNAAKETREVLEVYYYNAGGNANQQLQDVRSLINNEVDVIVVAFMDAQGYDMVTMMAVKENIPVVAYDAPSGSGFAFNVVPDQEAWGGVYGRFMAQRLTMGNVARILGNKESERGAARNGAIGTALAANAQITALEPSYAGGSAKTAKEAVAKYLSDNTEVAGVIVEEGMAEGVLDAFIEARKLPKVMCGDTTVGFIKKWYALKNGGVDVTPAAQNNATPPPAEMFAAQPGEFVVCAQPSPTGGAAVAFKVAVEMAKGRKLKTPGQTYRFTVQTQITDANLAMHYAKVKDMDNAYTVGEYITDTLLDSLLLPAAE